MESSPAANAAAAYFRAIRAGDREAWVATLAPTFRVEDPVGSPAKTSPDEMRQFFDGVMSAFSRLSIDEDHVYACGNRVAVKWSGMGLGKNGAEVSFSGIDVFEVDDQGRIVAMEGYWDPAAMMARLA